MRLGIFILAALASLLSAQQTNSEDVWKPFRYFAGSWDGHETGKVGIGKGERTYRFILGTKYLFSNNRSTFEPQEKNPKGEVHQDWTFFSYDRLAATYVMRQFNSEGFVNRFRLEGGTADKRLVFVSQASENAPPGLRARLTYEIKDNKRFTETFELAMPGRDFELLLTNHWTRRPGN